MTNEGKASIVRSALSAKVEIRCCGPLILETRSLPMRGPREGPGGDGICCWPHEEARHGGLCSGVCKRY